MKTKSYKYGPHRCKSYMKHVGKGYEVGFHFGRHPVFVGNFIHAKEANYWWNYMNKEIGTFVKRYCLTPKAPISWYCQFFSRHLYKCYYTYLDREFAKYQKNYSRAWQQDQKKYNQLRKNWNTRDYFEFRKTA